MSQEQPAVALGPARVDAGEGEAPRFEVSGRRRPFATAGRSLTRCFCRPGRAEPAVHLSPVHYLKQFHGKYADKDDARSARQEAQATQLGGAARPHGHMYRNDNPDLPTLEPWVLKTKPPAERFIFERNPYYYRVDAAGQQLPYIDRVILRWSTAS